MNKIYIPKKDQKLWSNCINPNLGGYPFFTSVYYLCPKARPSRYYGRFDCYLHFFNKGLMDTYQPKAGLEKAGKTIVSELLGGKKKYYRLLKQSFSRQRRAISDCQSYLDKDPKDWPKLWKKIKVIMPDSSNYIYSLDQGLDNFFSNLAAINPKEYCCLQSAFRPLFPSFIDEANNYLRQRLKKKHGNFNLVYGEFVNNFGWFQNSYQGRFKITKPWLKAYAKSVIKPQNAIDTKKSPRLPEKYRLLIAAGRLGINYRDDKKKLLLLAVELMDRWLNNYARANKMEYKALRWLCDEEIARLTPDIYRRAVRYEKSGRRYVLLDAEGFRDVPKDFFDWVAKLHKTGSASEIKGIGASPGKIIGRVKVVLDIKRDSKKLKRGDILVTSMTRPEHLPLMKTAAAFITNEGGLTCHAAIVAREMGKPCVIGTKNATRVLKDGDLVEIDPGKGIVRRIK